MGLRKLGPILGNNVVFFISKLTKKSYLKIGQSNNEDQNYIFGASPIYKL